MKIPRWLIRTPDFTINEFLAWIIVVGLSVALMPSLFGLAVGVAFGFIVVLSSPRVINAIRLKPWARRLLRRSNNG